MPTRRAVLVGGGAGIGLFVAWGLWPRAYAPNLVAAPGQHVLNGWIKIGEDGHVTAVVPQVELGQGAYTAVPQMLADELGADWRTIAVEPAPLNPIYANPAALAALFGGGLAAVPASVLNEHARRTTTVLTAGSSTVRGFEADLRAAGATARALLCMAASSRWDADWQACDTEAGFVTRGEDRVRFGEVAAAAAAETPPDVPPLRGLGAGKLTGQPVPRLDLPAKVDGSANFAGDIRLPDMVHAAIRQGPIGDSRLIGVHRAGAEQIRGVLSVIENPRFVAVVGTNWWAANRALDAIAPKFETTAAADDTRIARGLAAAIDGDGSRMVEVGDVGDSFAGARVLTAEYAVAPALHAAIEPMTATAQWKSGRLELWLATQSPAAARAAAARAIGIAPDQVVVHPMMVGGSFGGKHDPRVAEQAAILAQQLKRRVQLTWSRVEDLMHDRVRPPARARMAARIAPNGAILGWLAKIAAPNTGRSMGERLFGADPLLGAPRIGQGGDAYAVDGAVPPYAIPALAVDHHSADIGLPTGHWRSGAHSYTAFFNECFIDELSRASGIEPLSFRIALLGGNPRLARCLTSVAAIGGWDGGGEGSVQGIACHSMRGSHVAVLAEASIGRDQRVRVTRLVAAVDCGRQIHPDIARQQIEGGLVFGMAAALGASTAYHDGLADARRLRDLALPRLADMPDIQIEMIASTAEPGGVGEIAVPPVAPAIANALRAATGARLRSLPLTPGGS